MSATVVTGIRELVTCAGSDGQTPVLGAVVPAGDRLGIVVDAAVVVEGGLVAWVGPGRAAPEADRRVDLNGRAVVPGFVDSHSHLVFAGDRAAEFSARMAGAAYDGGGIGESVDATRAASDGELRGLLRRRVAEMRALGTTTVEVKSGYGLTTTDEERSLRLAREVTEETTFLGAHVVPPEFDDRTAYLDLVTGPMLTACAPHPRRLAVELGAASVYHFTYLTDADVAALVAVAGTTVATLLPGVEFSTRSPYPDARRLLDAGDCGIRDRLGERGARALRVDVVLPETRPDDVDELLREDPGKDGATGAHDLPGDGSHGHDGPFPLCAHRSK